MRDQINGTLSPFSPEALERISARHHALAIARNRIRFRRRKIIERAPEPEPEPTLPPRAAPDMSRVSAFLRRKAS